MSGGDITSFFTVQSLNADGGVTMLATEAEHRKSLYLTNQHGQKLLKLSVKSEVQKVQGKQHAQLKVITYGINRAWLWQDRPSDPEIVILHDGVELTYHGGQNGDKAPKVHIKVTTGRYTTLIEDSLSLPFDIEHPVPLFSFDTGYANQRGVTSPVTKAAHVMAAGSSEPVRFDFYLAGAGIDMQAFVNSMYFFNLFWTQDYLMAAKNHPLTSGLIIAPITFFHMGQYQLAVRRSISTHTGRPRLHFYSNKNYYEKLMNRRTATRNADGTLDWSTMRAEDARLRGESFAMAQQKGTTQD